MARGGPTVRMADQTRASAAHSTLSRLYCRHCHAPTSSMLVQGQRAPIVV
jgi:hypothetical protein